MKSFPKKMIAARLQNQKKQSGVLLIEVMIAVLIFSFGLLGLAGLQATAIQSSVNAEERIRASLLASDRVAMFWVRQSVTSSQVSDTDAWKAKVTSSWKDGGLPNATGSVAVDIPNNVATITITWKSPSKKTTDNNSKYETSIAMKS